jgi:hypothetical protein
MVVGWLIKALECGKKGEGSNFTLDILWSWLKNNHDDVIIKNLKIKTCEMLGKQAMWSNCRFPHVQINTEKLIITNYIFK